MSDRTERTPIVYQSTRAASVELDFEISDAIIRAWASLIRGEATADDAATALEAAARRAAILRSDERQPPDRAEL